MKNNVINKTVCWTVLCLMLMQGCTSYHTFDVGKSSEIIVEINEKAETRNASITMIDGNRYSTANLVFKPDTSHWYYEDETAPMNYPNSDISHIKFIDGKKGAWDGFKIGSGLGLLFGIGLCTLMAVVMPGGADDYPVDCALKAGISFGLISGLIGIAIGGKVGHTHIYIISNQDGSVRQTQ